MSDQFNIVQRQPTFEELREQYREANRQRLHASLREDYITFRDKDGRYLTHPDGSLVIRKTGYLTDAPEDYEHQRMDDYIAGGGSVPDVEALTQSLANEGNKVIGESVFAVLECPGLNKELRDLTRDAEAMRQHEKVKYHKEND